MINPSVYRLLLVAVAAALASCSPPPPMALPAPLVSVAQPQVATVTNWDEYPGHLEAVETVEIRPRVSGCIESIHFQDGAEVKVGDLLFVIDPRPFQAELERAQAERQRVETRLELTKNDLQRAESLRGTKAISEEEYDSRSKAVREAAANLAAAKAAEAVVQLNLGYTRVTAPISGRIGRRLVTAGNMVQGGGMMPGTVLATLVTTDPIYCYFDADERVFVQYRKAGAALGGRNNALPSCELALDGEEGFPHQGRIDFYDNQINPVAGTIRLRGVFNNRDATLVPGGFARVRLPVGQTASVLLIPEAAIGSEQTRKFVFVLNREQIVEPRPIQVGRQQGTQRAVLSGLKPDDRIVVNGLMLLRPGIKVQILNTNASAGPAPPPARK